MANSKRQRPTRPAARKRHSAARPFPIIGVGASAGGFDAMQRLLGAVAPRARLAIVYVQHLDPVRQSMLVPLLAAKTALAVQLASDGVQVAAGHVYVAPPHTDVALVGGQLRLAPRTKKRAPARTVDALFASLASGLREQAIGVVLSGNGDDGAAGVGAIKQAGGLVLAQQPNSAKHDGMPVSAATTGMVDLVLTPEEIGSHLTHLATTRRARVEEPVTDPLVAILQQLRAGTGIDFEGYKRPGMRRRIVRRMSLRKIQSLGAYARFLRDHPEGVMELRQDLLIGVSGFFRDPETFRVLERRVIPALLEARGPGAELRVWVPGCAAGEEAYSLAMALLDAHDQRQQVKVRVFATDVREDAIAAARAGVYSALALKGVSAGRRARFFHALDNGQFQVTKRLRDTCAFALHDLTRDPAFSRLDLVSCRNLLIYLQPAVQRSVIRMFHYALNPQGCLMLGSAESTGAAGLFAPYADKQHKIYLRCAAAVRQRGESLAVSPGAVAGRRPVHANEAKPGATDLAGEADRILLARFAPPSVLVDARIDVLQFRGDTAPYLRQPAGRATLALLKLVRSDLAIELRAALRRARAANAPAQASAGAATIEVMPVRMPENRGTGFLVMFQPTPVEATVTTRVRRGTRPSANPRLEQGLLAARAQLRVVIEEREAASEELQAAMEEVTSSNEELQSINEELETAKEELQSANDELTTINDELRIRNVQLDQVNIDLRNLLHSVNIPIVMLGRGLTVRRFTAAAEPLFHLIHSDIGRPIIDLRSSLDLPDFEPFLREVVARGKPAEREVLDASGKAYELWVRPYLTADGKCDGAVLAFFDISDRKRAQEALQFYAERLHLLGEIDTAVLAGRSLAEVARLALPRIRQFVAAAHVGVLLLDQQRTGATILVEDQDRPELAPTTTLAVALGDGRGGLSLSSTDNLCLPDLAAEPGRSPWLERLYRDGMRSFVSVPLAVEGRVIGRLFAAARPPRARLQEHAQWLRDVADHLAVAIEQARLYEKVRAARERLAGLAAHLVAAQEAERRRLAKELHDEVGQLLTGIKLRLGAVAARSPSSDLDDCIGQVDHLVGVVRTMSLDLRPTVLDDLGLLPALVTHNERFGAQTGVRVRFEHQGIDRRLPNEVETAAYRIVQEALTNVARHSGVREAIVRIWGDAERLTIQVSDSGVGFAPAAVATLRSSSGLSGMSERAAALGGELTIEAAPGMGTRLLASLPLVPPGEGGQP